ncbi:hypothetical protein H0H93_014344 [Arthromyces matolae]|nr:hypothetical protein H0H93_014344 [Arthromyces matolae]
MFKSNSSRDKSTSNAHRAMELNANMRRALEAIDSIEPVRDANGVDLTASARRDARQKILNQYKTSSTALHASDPFQKLLSSLLFFNQVSKAEKVFEKSVTNFKSLSDQATLDDYSAIKRQIATETTAKHGPKLAEVQADPNTPPAMKDALENIHRTSLEATGYTLRLLIPIFVTKDTTVV